MRRFLPWAAATVTFCLLSAAASAQPPGPNPFDRIDKDRDGKVTREEILDFFQNRFDEIDTNHDGALTRPEFDAFLGRRGGPGGPGGTNELGDAARQATLWIDPVTTAPPGTTYHLFDTHARGKGTQASYLIYLPPSYESSAASRYPVIYWLHGGGGTSRQGRFTVETIDRAIKAGKMPETIVVLVNGLPLGWYANSRDGKRPVENVIIQDLIPHIDATYRTINQREARGIEGFSMGGYGALHLGMKYPQLFGAISSVGPSILRNIKDEPIELTVPTFGDQEDYDENAPWTLAERNAAALKHDTAIRLLAGDQDFRLRDAIRSFDADLTRLAIPHEFQEIAGAGHQYDVIIEGMGDAAFAFWKQAFSRLK